MDENELKTKKCPHYNTPQQSPLGYGYCMGSPCSQYREIKKTNINPTDPFASLSVRTTSILKNAGITTVQEIRDYSDGEILRWPNCGRKSLNEMKELMGRFDNDDGAKDAVAYCGLAGKP